MGPFNICIMYLLELGFMICGFIKLMFLQVLCFSFYMVEIYSLSFIALFI
jgi:hypothetical protein